MSFNAKSSKVQIAKPRWSFIAASKIKWGPVPMHSWRIYVAALLDDQTVCTMVRYYTQPHYSDTLLISRYPVLLLPIVWLGSEKCQFYKSLVWLGWVSNSKSSKWEVDTLSIWPPSPYHLRSGWPLTGCVLNAWGGCQSQRTNGFCICSPRRRSRMVQTLAGSNQWPKD